MPLYLKTNNSTLTMKTMTPNDLGKKFVIDECQKIDVNSFLKITKQKIKELLLETEIDVSGIDIKLATSKTGFGGTRYWFKCPKCNKRVGTVFIHPVSHNLGCRECLGLEYRNRRYKGMLEEKLF
jgi:hypothetical protein